MGLLWPGGPASVHVFKPTMLGAVMSFSLMGGGAAAARSPWELQNKLRGALPVAFFQGSVVDGPSIARVAPRLKRPTHTTL
eukprot:6249861-Alexandrium_andersonii.AAC.1